MLKKIGKTLAIIFAITIFLSCSPSAKGKILPDAFSKSYKTTQNQLESLLTKPDLRNETRYAVVNRIANNMLSVKDYGSLTCFLTNWVEQHPDDPYNAYWLLMTAYAYLENDAEPVAEYYFERIINNYNDLMVQGKSIHFVCLQHLIQISESPAARITYFNQLISHFPNNISTTELFYRLALEYEKEGEWKQAIRSFTQYLDQDDASTLQISGYPNAYLSTKQLIDFSNSSKDWTFETLDALVAAVKKGISSYNYRALDRYKSKVNFFAMSWRQVETDVNAQESFSMRSFMRGNRIRYSAELDSSSSPTEAYLRTTGWSNYVNVWYLYFRKVNFPADPEIHGRWEWAGIYYGEKL
ncbi:MAG: tetratricopeptide repeat protein [Treponema sp.]|nr:tetratricopeptide repeat protein [Spirochaetia bacterium]MDD7458903.1 tetratricopeptide repeat protein [Spirochaetales bacterium]MDY5810482.1 tetratricopeptide repeat protein [Treponema sp.]